MISPTLVGLVIAIVILETLGQFMVKLYYENKNKVYLFFIAWLLYLGVISVLSLMYNYSKIAIANVLWNSGTTILMALVGWFYFGEPLGIGEIAGIILVITGSLTIGFSSKDK
jgi:multidrug transporter EmrE-like cation transporter